MFDIRAFFFYAPRMEETEFRLLNPLADGEVSPGKVKREFTVAIVHDPVRDEWIAATGLMKFVGQSAADALHELANALDTIGVYGADKATADEYRHKNSKPCIYCGALIFFGQLDSGKWLPLDADPILAAQAVGARLATFVDYKGQHMVRFPPKPQGRVWIPHPTVCGTNSTEPLQPALRKRWQERRDGATARAAEDKRNAISMLTKIAHDLTEGDIDGIHAA